jgi:hypothetical protein
MKENNKVYLIAALWFICGNLTWKSAAYLFGNFTSHLVFPIFSFTNKVLHIHLRAAFVVYTITDLIIIFLIALLLSTVTGKRNIWNLTYIVGAVGWPLYYTIRNHIDIYHHNLPVWNTLILSITVLVIITPLVAWVGTILGNQYQMRRTRQKLPRPKD